MHRPASRALTRYSVPSGDSPYALAKRAQIVDKYPNRAIALYWRAVNEGDRADSALKDMAMLMKTQDRSEEAIQAITSLRNRCSYLAQESLDNILLDLYKNCNRLDDQIALMKHKLIMIETGLAFNGQRTKIGRSQGKKFKLTVEQEAIRILGNLGWALMQKENYAEAEAVFRRTVIIRPDNNKLCNLGICLMKQGKVLEAKEVLMHVKSPNQPNPLSDSDLKAFERAQEMLRDLERRKIVSWSFEVVLDQSAAAIWQPHPCVDFYLPSIVQKENLRPRLNVNAQPFYCSKAVRKFGIGNQNDGLLWNFKRKSVENLYPHLPSEKEFEEGLIGAVLSRSALLGGKRVRF